MKTYQIDIRTAAEYAEHEVEAATPAEALTITRTLWDDDPEAFEWQSFDGIQKLDGITVMDDAGNHLVNWTDPEAQKALAAASMLEALRQAVTALNTVSRFSVPSLESDSYTIAALCDASIRDASG